MYARGATPDSPHVAGWSRPPGEHVPESPAAMPATCVPWNDASRSIGNRPGRPRVRPGKRARDDHLRRRPLPAALREARRIGETGGIEERVRVVDAVVDDCDLDPVAVRACERLQLVGADHRRARVGRRGGSGRWDRPSARSASRASARQLRRRQRHRQAVEHDLEAPADSRLLGSRAGAVPPRHAVRRTVAREVARARRRSPRPASASPPWAAKLGRARPRGRASGRPTITRTRPEAWFRGMLSVPARTRGRFSSPKLRSIGTGARTGGNDRTRAPPRPQGDPQNGARARNLAEGIYARAP